jgi:ADP-ribosylation factor-like protein 9
MVKNLTKNMPSFAVGGTENLQPYWKRYMCKAMVLVFVVDSSNAAQFPLAKKHLHELLETDLYLPLVVLANKQVRLTY